MCKFVKQCIKKVKCWFFGHGFEERTEYYGATKEGKAMFVLMKGSCINCGKNHELP